MDDFSEEIYNFYSRLWIAQRVAAEMVNENLYWKMEYLTANVVTNSSWHAIEYLKGMDDELPDLVCTMEDVPINEYELDEIVDAREKYREERWAEPYQYNFNTMWIKIVKEIPNLRRTPREIIKIAFRSMIDNKRKIFESFKKEECYQIGNKILTSEEKFNAIETLLTYKDKKLENLKKTINVPLHYIFFSFEKIIKLAAKLNAEQENALMIKHNLLMRELKMCDSYSTLFAPILPGGADDELIKYFPSVLSGVITNYCGITILSMDEKEEDVIISRILLK